MPRCRRLTLLLKKRALRSGSALDEQDQPIVDPDEVGRAKAGGVVPAGGGRIVEVVALGDVEERMLAGCFLREPVEDAGTTNNECARSGCQALVHQGITAGPDGRGCAGAAVPGPFPLGENRHGPGDCGDIGNLTPTAGVFILDSWSLLPGGEIKGLAQATTRSPGVLAIGRIVGIA